MCSATDSAVSVLPTPGGPWRIEMSPRPLPLITSPKLFWELAWESTSDCISSFQKVGRTRKEKALLFQMIGAIQSTWNSAKLLVNL